MRTIFVSFAVAIPIVMCFHIIENVNHPTIRFAAIFIASLFAFNVGWIEGAQSQIRAMKRRIMEQCCRKEITKVDRLNPYEPPGQ